MSPPGARFRGPAFLGAGAGTGFGALPNSSRSLRLRSFFFRFTFALRSATVRTSLFLPIGAIMNPLWIAAALFGLILIGLVVWVLVQNTQDQKKNEALESQLNELRRDLLTFSNSQAQSSATMQTI